MCFNNLPVEFDENGRPYLREDVPDPYSVATEPSRQPGDVQTLTRDQIEDLLARNGHIQEKDFDPVTRVAGALAFHSVVDLDERKVIESRSVATLFRGYEVIMMGRDPRDALYITSRTCGVCGGVHATCASLAIEMAIGVKPPPMGIVVRNLLLALEFLYDNPLHLFLLAGPDYSEHVIKPTNPELWDRATGTSAPNASVHGYETIGDIMTDLNPLTGRLYLEAIHMTRVAREAYVLIGGKYPHPQTVVPGGVSATVNISTFNEIYVRLQQFFDYGKKTVAIYDDLCDFFYDADPEYRNVGRTPANLIDCGIWDDPWAYDATYENCNEWGEKRWDHPRCRTPANLIDCGIWDDPWAYDATYENCNEWGEKRWATPGVIVNGEQVTTKLQNINVGLEEFVDHSFYDEWDGHEFKTDELGAPLSPYHPWNKSTRPHPQGQSWREKYTWSTAPRWDRMAMDAEAGARLWNTAIAQKIPENDYIHATGSSLRLIMPQGKLPEMELEWHVPDIWNAFERNRSRAYSVAYTALVALNVWRQGMDLMKQGETSISTPFEIPTEGRQIGVGFWGAGRGFLTHHVIIEDGVCANYQIITPSTTNASPRDHWDNPGMYETAVLNTPILETSDRENFQGIDILRAIRSFDPCMPCTTHVHTDERHITREVNTCACGLEH